MGGVIRKILVPNRGEIAIRVARTCREMGIAAVLAHSADDCETLAVSLFDEAVSLGEGDARETYLNIGRIIDAARASGADAIHPGYGFLSERAELAAACDEAGIIFIGPTAESIDLMGSKAESRRRMESLGVPVIPGYHGKDQTNERFGAEAARIGFPVLVKASAGGGGKGMKIVHAASELSEALESARREAMKAFGNERLLLERFIERPRHVEFQVFGDGAGKVLHLYERDCSVQRRHQKVIEETPAPHYPDDLRKRMALSAIASAEGVSYRNAGTVEFILAPDGEFYFLEMNTRLQVEHPVTEAVLGIDLVRAQIELASGGSIPWKQEDLSQRGHAIECRIYAEDADEGFLPQTGTVSFYREPAGPGVRVDSGIRSGSVISHRYDPLLAKVITHAESRESCVARMSRALTELVILGTTTNASYLKRIVDHPDFAQGSVDTTFLNRHSLELRDMTPLESLLPVAAALAAATATTARPASSGPDRVPPVWESIGPWGL